MLDTLRLYETPEGIDLELRLAGPTVRAAAWVIDMLIRAGVYIGLSIIFSLFGALGAGAILISIFLIEWFYPVVFEVISGATPGKKNMGLIVTHDNGTPISWYSSLIRNLLRTVDILPFIYGFGLISMLLNRDFKRLGDIAAGTIVIYKDKAHSKKAIPEANPKPLPKPLYIEEQRTILDFAERSQQLSESRRQELVNILEPYTQKQGDEAVNELYQYANWLQRG